MKLSGISSVEELYDVYLFPHGPLLNTRCKSTVELPTLSDVLPRLGKRESQISCGPIAILLQYDHLREHLRPTNS